MTFTTKKKGASSSHEGNDAVEIDSAEKEISGSQILISEDSAVPKVSDHKEEKGKSIETEIQNVIPCKEDTVGVAATDILCENEVVLGSSGGDKVALDEHVVEGGEEVKNNNGEVEPSDGNLHEKNGGDLRTEEDVEEEPSEGDYEEEEYEDIDEEEEEKDEEGEGEEEEEEEEEEKDEEEEEEKEKEKVEENKRGTEECSKKKSQEEKVAEGEGQPIKGNKKSVRTRGGTEAGEQNAEKPEVAPKTTKKSSRRSRTEKQRTKKSESRDKPETLHERNATKRVETMGMVFMCSTETKSDCYHYRILGLPESKKSVVEKIYAGMRLFLYDVDLKLMYGIYKAAAPGGYNIVPKAFKSQFPSQVRFKVLKDCLPLAEEKFKDIIKDNYYTRTKFNCQLNSLQVRKLCSLFTAVGNVPPPKSGAASRGGKPLESQSKRQQVGRRSGKRVHSERERRNAARGVAAAEAEAERLQKRPRKVAGHDSTREERLHKRPRKAAVASPLAAPPYHHHRAAAAPYHHVTAASQPQPPQFVYSVTPRGEPPPYRRDLYPMSRSPDRYNGHGGEQRGFYYGGRDAFIEEEDPYRSVVPERHVSYRETYLEDLDRYRDVVLPPPQRAAGGILYSSTPQGAAPPYRDNAVLDPYRRDMPDVYRRYLRDDYTRLREEHADFLRGSASTSGGGFYVPYNIRDPLAPSVREAAPATEYVPSRPGFSREYHRHF